MDKKTQKCSDKFCVKKIGVLLQVHTMLLHSYHDCLKDKILRNNDNTDICGIVWFFRWAVVTLKSVWALFTEIHSSVLRVVLCRLMPCFWFNQPCGYVCSSVKEHFERFMNTSYFVFVRVLRIGSRSQFVPVVYVRNSFVHILLVSVTIQLNLDTCNSTENCLFCFHTSRLIAKFYIYRRLI